MANFPISPKKETDLLNKMHRLGLKENDIEERFIRSRGPGGQNVNKASTCVYLKHLPTGLEVKYSRQRSQALNRYFARRILANKIESLILGKASKEQQRIEKIRRQKRKRSKKAKLKLWAFKKIRAEKKALRSPIRNFE